MKKFGAGDGNTLRVTTTEQQQSHVSEAQLRRTLRSLLAQREREIQRSDRDIAEVREMLEACDGLGIRGESLLQPASAPEPMELAKAPATLGKRMWKFLTKPRLTGG